MTDITKNFTDLFTVYAVPKLKLPKFFQQIYVKDVFNALAKCILFQNHIEVFKLAPFGNSLQNF